MIPFWHKFHFKHFTSPTGDAIRLFLGIFFICIDNRFSYDWNLGMVSTGMWIGFIPWKIREGDLLKGLSWQSITYLKQEVWNG